MLTLTLLIGNIRIFVAQALFDISSIFSQTIQLHRKLRNCCSFQPGLNRSNLTLNNTNGILNRFDISFNLSQSFSTAGHMAFRVLKILLYARFFILKIFNAPVIFVF